jgi:hypothetical protein
VDLVAVADLACVGDVAQEPVQADGGKRPAAALPPPNTGASHVDTLSIDKSTLAGYRVIWPSSLVSLPGMAPATMHGANPGDPMWFVGTGSSSTNLKVLEMDNPLSSSPNLTRSLVTVPSYTSMPRPTQPGGTMSWSFDTRILNATMLNGQLYADHTVGSGVGQAGPELPV